MNGSSDVYQTGDGREKADQTRNTRLDRIPSQTTSPRGFHLTIRPYRRSFGALDCTVVDGGADPTVPVVLCHGYGAPGDDLVPFAAHWIELLGARSGTFRFVFPAASQNLADLGMPDGRAWWPINMQRLMMAVQAKDFSELQVHEPPGISEARRALVQTVEAVMADLPQADAPLVLGGFSQGAMLTMDASLRGLSRPPDILLQMSGTLVCRPQWQPAMMRLQATQVIQSHGRRDPILPFEGAVALRDLMQQAGVDVHFIAFDGPHTVDMEMLSRVAMALSEVADRP